MNKVHSSVLCFSLVLVIIGIHVVDSSSAINGQMKRIGENFAEDEDQVAETPEQRQKRCENGCEGGAGTASRTSPLKPGGPGGSTKPFPKPGPGKIGAHVMPGGGGGAKPLPGGGGAKPLPGGGGAKPLPGGGGGGGSGINCQCDCNGLPLF